jgi:hypothetical protein
LFKPGKGGVMKIFHVRRDSVSFGDDADGPYELAVSQPDSVTLQELLTLIGQSDFLPTILGDEATWIAISGVPLAVIAYRWRSPKMLPRVSLDHPALQKRGEAIQINLTYRRQDDPKQVYIELLRECSRLPSDVAADDIEWPAARKSSVSAFLKRIFFR